MTPAAANARTAADAAAIYVAAAAAARAVRRSAVGTVTSIVGTATSTGCVLRITRVHSRHWYLTLDRGVLCRWASN